MDRERCVVILLTHSKYLDICKIFVDLFYKNWRDCPYRMVVSVTGYNNKYMKKNPLFLYNGEDATLPMCLYNAVEKFPADYYCSFLGDAFISKKINQRNFSELLENLNKNNIEYCSLLPQRAYGRKKLMNANCRYIHSTDRYSHSFIAFIANEAFINREFKEKITDLEFEEKYLEIANQKQPNFYFKQRVILDKNIFSIYPGIVKGKWERNIYNSIKKKNPEINLGKRKIHGFCFTVYLFCVRNIIQKLPNKIRIIIKKVAEKLNIIHICTKY